ncbi:uncharacterized protein LOC128205328 [Mya arenaria]|uniref:uncharacterized protein LOC128205328 n=1 Tax=Mya arenaria TaxID=6604 RepID=UPI0022E4BE4A|nr:uncharacterized protein LOC128205328 [Mya arenaria]
MKTLNMNPSSKRGRSKDGVTVQRSEYSDDILRNNRHSGNRLRNDLTYYDRAQKVIMKDLGKEAVHLQSKLESDRKTLALGLYGSQINKPGPPSSRKYTPSSSNVYKQTPRSTTTAETKFPWEKDAANKETTADRGSSNIESARTKSSARMAHLSGLSVNRPPADDFLTSILNEAMADELLYTQSVEASSPYRVESTSKTPRSSRRKTKTPRSRMLLDPRDSIVNSLSNATVETDEVIY